MLYFGGRWLISWRQIVRGSYSLLTWRKDIQFVDTPRDEKVHFTNPSKDQNLLNNTDVDENKLRVAVHEVDVGNTIARNFESMDN